MRNHRLAVTVALMCSATAALAQVKAVPGVTAGAGVPAVFGAAALPAGSLPGGQPVFALPLASSLPGGAPTPIEAGNAAMSPGQVDVWAGPLVHRKALAHTIEKLGGRYSNSADGGRYSYITGGPEQAAAAALALSRVKGPSVIEVHPQVVAKLAELPAANGLAAKAAQLVEALERDPYHGLANYYDGMGNQTVDYPEAGGKPTQLARALAESTPGRPLSVAFDDVDKFQRETARVIRRNSLDAQAFRFAGWSAVLSATGLGALFLRPGWIMTGFAASAGLGAAILLMAFLGNLKVYKGMRAAKIALLNAAFLTPALAVAAGVVLSFQRGALSYALGAVGVPLTLFGVVLLGAWWQSRPRD